MSGPVSVTIRYSGGGADVRVAGQFSEWQQRELERQEEDGVWSLVLSLQPGSYQYKFVVDGAWITDDRLPTADDGSGNRNNLLSVEAAAADNDSSSGDSDSWEVISAPKEAEAADAGVQEAAKEPQRRQAESAAAAAAEKVVIVSRLYCGAADDTERRLDELGAVVTLTNEFTDEYLDTEDHRLQAAGVWLRRRDGKDWLTRRLKDGRFIVEDNEEKVEQAVAAHLGGGGGGGSLAEMADSGRLAVMCRLDGKEVKAALGDLEVDLLHVGDLVTVTLRSVVVEASAALRAVSDTAAKLGLQRLNLMDKAKNLRAD